MKTETKRLHAHLDQTVGQVIGLLIGLFIGVAGTAFYGVTVYTQQIREDQKHKTLAAVDKMVGERLAKMVRKREAENEKVIQMIHEAATSDPERLAPGTKTMLGDDGEYHGQVTE